MQKALDKIQKFIIILGVVLFPVFILPGFSSPYFVPKEIFLAGIVSIALIAGLLKSIINGEIKFSYGKFDFALTLLTLVYILSAIIKTPNKMEAFFYPGTATFAILALVLYLLINQFTKYSKRNTLVAVFVSGILLSIFMLFTELKVFSFISQLPSFMSSINFNSMGSTIGSIVFLLAVLSIGIIYVIKEKDIVKKVFFSISSLIIVATIVLTGTKLFTQKSQELILPSWQTSWIITIESFKNSPIFGVGPGNYITAFNIYRPLSYNQTDLWQTKFSSANNFYFTLFTELGLAGTIAIIILLIAVYRKISFDMTKKKSNWEIVSLIILLLALFFIPIAPALLVLLMILLSIFSSSEEKYVVIATNKISSLIVSAPVIIAIILTAFFGAKAVAAEMNYKKSLDALTKNDARGTYDYMTKAATQNPYVDRYRASLAQVNLALANSIATKEELTDIDRSTISQLVQQAISEGKAAVTLNIGRSANWEILAQIYRSILAFAQGADQFAIQTFSQAVALDPINPELRVSLGGVYYALGDYDNAITSFQLAVAAKNNLANAHYNLAAAYAAKKDYDKAIKEMNTVLSLVDENSEDYKTAQTTLLEYQTQKPVNTENQISENSSATLTQPETVEEPIIKPPIELPEEATPPAVTE